MKTIAMFILCAAACAATPPELPTCSEIGCPAFALCSSHDGPCECRQSDGEQLECMPDRPLAVTWSATGDSDSPGVPDPIVCGEVLWHPCPLMVYERGAFIDLTAKTIRWLDADGSADLNGWTASTHPPIVDTIDILDDGSITIGDKGDGAGLRHTATLAPSTTGYEGDVTWSLFTVAGHTTWHVVIR